MSDRMTFEDTRSAISLLESADGLSPCRWQAGQQIDMFGLDHAPAKVSARRGSAKARQTKGICGPSGTSSSKPASLQSFLANRLKQQLGTDGSILFRMTWRDRVTKSGRPYCQLVASARTTSEKDCGSWPTVNANNWRGAYQDLIKIFQRKANGRQTNLQDVARMATWPTPTVSQAGGTAEQFLARKSKANGGDCKAVTDLGMVARMATWPTVSTRDHKGGYIGGRIRNGKLSTDTLDVTAQLASGQNPTGSGAEMENTGQLNPEHCRWLMGYPKEWSRFADMAMP